MWEYFMRDPEVRVIGICDRKLRDPGIKNDGV